MDQILYQQGFDHEKLTSHQINGILVDQKVPAPTSTKKPELVQRLEKLCSLKRTEAGREPQDYLEPDFSVDDYTKAKMRQVLVQNGLDYKIGLNKDALKELFRDNLESMRAIAQVSAFHVIVVVSCSYG